MSEPVLETQEVEVVAGEMHHILCAECVEEPTTYLCGTPRPPVGEKIVPLDAAPDNADYCPVCFGSETLICNTCGTEIVCHP
jgi:hypothetical protein